MNARAERVGRELYQKSSVVPFYHKTRKNDYIGNSIRNLTASPTRSTNSPAP
jgi:hypothetical protein